MSLPVSRRGSILALAAQAASAQTAPSIPLGVATTDFRDHTNQSLAQELKSQRIRRIQLFFTQKDSNYWKYGAHNPLHGMTPERAREIAAIYRGAGITIDALGVYATLIHPDPAERRAHLAYFDAMMKVGADMGVHTFLSEMGHYHPATQPTNVYYDWQDDVWNTAVATGKELAAIAAANNATVLLEPIYRSLLASAKRTRLYLEEVGSPRVKAQLDPANLLEVNDLDEMFAQLKPWIGALHAKDRKHHVTKGVAAGQGDLDYRKFVTLAARQSPGVPLTVEYVGSADYRQALAHLRSVLRAAGIREL